MRAVIQRVKSASVTVDDEVVSSIGRGLLVLVGLTGSDGPREMQKVVRKVLQQRLWPDEAGAQWKKSVQDLGYEVLCVSQFTLYGSTSKGQKPSFHAAMGPPGNQIMYNEFVQSVKDAYESEKVKDGRFGAMMDVALVNDGPVTILLDETDIQEPSQQGKKSKTPSRTPPEADGVAKLSNGTEKLAIDSKTA